jgi:hypothetical protein
VRHVRAADSARSMRRAAAARRRCRSVAFRRGTARWQRGAAGGAHVQGPGPARTGAGAAAARPAPQRAAAACAGAAEPPSRGARRRLGAARMRRGTYAEPPRHAGTVAQSPPGVAPRAGTAEPVGTSRGSLPVGASSTVATTSRSEPCTPVGPPRGCGHSRAATWLRRHGGA